MAADSYNFPQLSHKRQSKFLFLNNLTDFTRDICQSFSNPADYKTIKSKHRTPKSIRKRDSPNPLDRKRFLLIDPDEIIVAKRNVSFSSRASKSYM